MRTTVTLTPEADALIRRAMAERGISFAEAINAAVIASYAAASDRPVYRTPTFNMGPPKISLDHTMRVLADLDDEEFLRKTEARR